MPEPLICPQCGAPLTSWGTSCPYCHIQFFDKTTSSAKRTSAAPLDTEHAIPTVHIPLPPPPPGWEIYTNSWVGVNLFKPQGWQVVCSKGVVSVRKDVVGLTAANIQPIRLQSPLPIQQVAQWWISQVQLLLPGVQSWIINETPPNSSRLTLRIQAHPLNTPIVGAYCIIVNGADALISGFHAPTQVIDEESSTLQNILSSFQTIDRMPRQVVREPVEGACSLSIPNGWLAQINVNRGGVGNAAQIFFDIRREQQGFAQISQPCIMWNFTEGSMPFMGIPMPNQAQSMTYQPAASLCQSFFSGWLRRYHPDIVVESVVDRPDFIPYFAYELFKTGQNPNQIDLSVAILTFRFSEGGKRLRQRARLLVYHPRSLTPNFGFLSTPTAWYAFCDSYHRAPEDEFDILEPVLEGILDSYQANPAWQQNEIARNNAYIRNSQMEQGRRLRQISKTLSESSDILNQGYWERQESQDRISHERSNVILGYQDMVDSSGTVYNVPSGHEQYWRDNLDNIYAGGWLVNPDPNWTPLESKGL